MAIWLLGGLKAIMVIGGFAAVAGLTIAIIFDLAEREKKWKKRLGR